MFEDESAPDVPNDDAAEAPEAEVSNETISEESSDTESTTEASGDVGLEAISAEVDGLSDAMATSRFVRLGILIIMICFVGYFANKYYKFALEFSSPEFQEELLTNAESHFFEGEDSNVAMEREGKKLVDSVVRTLQTALKDQVDADMEDFKAIITSERETLARNLEAQLNELVNTRYLEILEQHQAVLDEKFPELDKEQMANLMANLETAMNQVLREHYYNEIQGKLKQLYSSYDNFPVAEPHVATADDETVEDAFFRKAARVASNKLSDIADDAPAGDAPPAAEPEKPAGTEIKNAAPAAPAADGDTE